MNRCYNHILVVDIKKGLGKTKLLMSYLSLNVTFFVDRIIFSRVKITYKVMPFDFLVEADGSGDHRTSR